jgi:hypothetical protein
MTGSPKAQTAQRAATAATLGHAVAQCSGLGCTRLTTLRLCARHRPLAQAEAPSGRKAEQIAISFALQTERPCLFLWKSKAVVNRAKHKWFSHIHNTRRAIMKDETDPGTQLAWLAASCWLSGIVGHKQQHPEDCDKIVELIGAGTVTPFVMIEPGCLPKCGYKDVKTQACTWFAVVGTEEAPPNWQH